MKSLKEHLDKKDVQKLLGEVLHQAGRQGSSPAPDLEVLTKVILSRYVLQIWADVHAGSAALACLKLETGSLLQAKGEQSTCEMTVCGLTEPSVCGQPQAGCHFTL